MDHTNNNNNTGLSTQEISQNVAVKIKYYLTFKVSKTSTSPALIDFVC